MSRNSLPLKLVFKAVLIVTIGSGLGDALIAYIWTDPTHNQQEIFDAFNFAWKAGIGAIFGLLRSR
jgi:hypothetical protein